jgi:hypothetical protein
MAVDKGDETLYRVKERVPTGSTRRLFVAAHLRVYPTPERAAADVQAPTVRISLRDLLPLIALAQRRNYLWLSDFLDDEVKVTPDLYEVLRAFRACRPSA